VKKETSIVRGVSLKEKKRRKRTHRWETVMNRSNEEGKAAATTQGKSEEERHCQGTSKKRDKKKRG